MKSTKPKISIQRLRVLRADFQLLSVLKDDIFTKNGSVRKQARKGITDLLKYDAHNFIEAQNFESIMANATIEYEDVEVEELPEVKRKPTKRTIASSEFDRYMGKNENQS